MMLLFNYTFDCYLAFKIFNQGIDFIPSCINTVFGTFQRYLRKMASMILYFWNRNKHFFKFYGTDYALLLVYLITCYSWPRERNDNTPKFFSNVPKNFTAFGNEVAMMFRVNCHCFFNNIIL